MSEQHSNEPAGDPRPEESMGDEAIGRPIDVPPGSTTVRQTSWAWLWGGIPWVALAILFGALEPTSPVFILAVALGVAVTIPRYLMWRRTVYYITHDGVIFQRGLIGTPQMYHLPAASFQRIVQRPGLFGNVLNYHAIDIRMREGGRVSLAYVPSSAGMMDRLLALRDRYSDYDEEREMMEIAIIEARQRGEEIPDEYQQEGIPDQEFEPTQVVEVAEPEPERDPPQKAQRPDRSPPSSEARVYRPDASGYSAGRSDRGRRDGERR